MATETHFSELQEKSGDLLAPPRPTLPPGDDREEISLIDLLIVLAARKRTIFAVTALCGITALAISFMLHKKYTATAVLLPPQQNSSLGAALASQVGSNGLGSIAALAGGALGIKDPNEMYVAMIESHTVEDAVVERFGLMKQYHTPYISDARARLATEVKVASDAKNNLITITVTDGNPEEAAKLANGYVDAFQDLTSHLAITEAGHRRVFFEAQLEQAKDNLAKAEEALKATQQSTGLIELDSQARALIESAASLRAQITMREVQLEAMKTYATDQNAQLIQVQQELDSLRAQLAKLGGSEDTPDSLIVPKGLVPQAGLEYVRRVRDVKYYEAIFQILARQYEAAKLDEAKEGTLLQVLDPAERPIRKSFPKKSLIVIGGTIAGFFLGILAAFAQAKWVRIKEDPESSAKLALLKQTMLGRSGFTP